MSARIHALIPAAGYSVRFGGTTLKQYAHLLGSPVIAHSIDAVSRHPAVGAVGHRRPVVRGDDDHRVGHAATGLQKVQKLAKLGVALGDKAHIGRDHRLPHLVARESLTGLVVHEGLVDRMGIFPFAVMTDGRDHIGGAVKIVPRRGHVLCPWAAHGCAGL